MLKEDRIRLQHVLDAAKEAVAFSQDKSRSDFAQDRKLLLSVVKCIEIIGEAAGSVTVAVTGKHPGIPWTALKAMRNRLAHAYFDINTKTVWDTVSQDLPALIRAVEGILAERDLPG